MGERRGFLPRLNAAWRALSVKSAPPSEDLLRQFFGYATSKSGQTVNAETALRVSAVLGCVRTLSEGVSQVPLKLMRETAPGQKTEARDLPLYDVLHRRPNPWQTSFAFRETLMLHLLTTGNFYAFINRANGDVRELIPLEPKRVTARRERDYRLVYEVEGENGVKRALPQAAVWHVRWMSNDGWQGLDPIRLAREAIGLAMATEESQANLHKNGLRVSGVYSVEDTLKDEQYKNLRTWIMDTAMGGAGDGGFMLLDRGAKFTPTALSGVDSQHLENRRQQIEEICRFYRVMPIMVGHYDKSATYASAEQMFLAHVVHTMMPWYERLQQSIEVDLLSAEQRAAGYYAKFNANALLRGDSKARAEFYTKLYSIGMLSPNEGRDLEDMDRYEGGDERRVPLNMTVPGAAQPEPDPETDSGSDAAAAA